MNEYITGVFKIILFFVILGTIIFLLGLLFNSITEKPIKVQLESGYEMLVEEFKCYEICEGRNYLYEPSNNQKQMLCVCGEKIK